MRIVQFDTRNTPEARAHNEAIFALGDVLGIEITDPALATRCTRNIDHHGADCNAETPSACRQALDVSLENIPEVIALLRPDADSLAAAAVLSATLRGEVVNRDWVAEIDEYDRRGPACRTAWSDSLLAVCEVLDHGGTLGEKVNSVRQIIAPSRRSTMLDDFLDSAYIRSRAELYRAKLARLREYCAVEMRGPVALVTVASAEQFNPAQVGYESADVVVVFNDRAPIDFADPAKGTHRKYTICRRDSNVPVNLAAALAELSRHEPGWGGRADIIGSPQGRDSRFTTDEVVAIVARHVPTDEPADFDDIRGALEGGGMAFISTPPDLADQPETPVYYSFGMRPGAAWRSARVGLPFVEKAMKYLTQDGGWSLSNHTDQTHFFGCAIPPNGASWNQTGVGVMRGNAYADLFWRVADADGRPVDRYRPGSRSVQEREDLFRMLRAAPRGLRYIRRGESRTGQHAYFTVHVAAANVTALATAALADPFSRSPRKGRGGYSGSAEQGKLLMVWIADDGEGAALRAATDSLGAALGPGMGPWMFAAGLAEDPSGCDGEIPFTVE